MENTRNDCRVFVANHPGKLLFRRLEYGRIILRWVLDK
jgi:hypothetical protein